MPFRVTDELHTKRRKKLFLWDSYCGFQPDGGASQTNNARHSSIVPDPEIRLSATCQPHVALAAKLFSPKWRKGHKVADTYLRPASIRAA